MMKLSIISFGTNPRILAKFQTHRLRTFGENREKYTPYAYQGQLTLPLYKIVDVTSRHDVKMAPAAKKHVLRTHDSNETHYASKNRIPQKTELDFICRQNRRMIHCESSLHPRYVII